ncbi:MAG: hypothetical protein AB7G93_02835 [Bdellovibrionales bacterium]
MPSCLKLRHFTILVAVGLLLPFQNCAQQEDENALNSVASYQQNLPMAYDIRLDTIAFMSCSEIKDPVERRAYFTLRAGAFKNTTGGLAMTQAFRDATQYYSVTDRARSFAASDKNSNTLLSLSLRSASNYQVPWSSEEIRVGEELEPLLPPLDSAEVAGPLAALTDGERINYFPGSHEHRLMEASLRFYKYENVAKDTRNALDAGDALLVAGLSNSSAESDTALRGPSGVSSSSVYGVGYRLGFSLPAGYTSGERRVLSGPIQEIDLTTKTSSSGNWDCSTTYQFMVIRPEDRDAGLVICNSSPDRYNDSTEQAALNAIRRVLRVEDWFVDVTHHCVMPKNSGDYCYGALNGKAVQYGVASCSNTSTTLCPHFVSVCLRK